MSKEEFQCWKKENPSKYEILLEDEKLIWNKSFEEHKDDDVAFYSSNGDPKMRVFTYGRVRLALENRNDICDELLRMHLQSIYYAEERGLYSAEKMKAIKDDFEKYNDHIRCIIKKEANSFYNGVPNYEFINECRMTFLKKLSAQYNVCLYKCCELVNWEAFEKEKQLWLEMKKKMDDDSKNGASFPSFDPSIAKRITEETIKLKEMALGMALDEAGISKELLEKKD